MSDTDREALADMIHTLFLRDLRSSGDVADYLIANRAAVLRALGLREERQQSMGGLHIPVPRRRFVTEWEDVTDDE